MAGPPINNASRACRSQSQKPHIVLSYLISLLGFKKQRRATLNPFILHITMSRTEVFLSVLQEENKNGNANSIHTNLIFTRDIHARHHAFARGREIHRQEQLIHLR